MEARVAEIGVERLAFAVGEPRELEERGRRLPVAALQAFVKSEIDKWGPIIKKAGQYAD